jgi:hypothetical protein
MFNSFYSGSIMREVKAPSRIGKMETTVELKSRNWQARSEAVHAIQTQNYVQATQKWNKK